MDNMVHAAFMTKADGIAAAESLLYHGARAEDISLILPDHHPEHEAGAGTEPHIVDLAATLARQTSELALPHVERRAVRHPEVPAPPELPPLPPRSKPAYYDQENVMAPGATGYTYDELGAVIPDSPGRRRKSSRRKGPGYTVIDTEEGVGVGLGLGLLTALCIPGIGMFAGTATIVASCMAGGAAVGGIGGGIYGFLTDRGAADRTARKMSDHVNAGGAALSVTLSNTGKEAEVIRIIKGFNGCIIEHSHQD